MTQLFQRPEKPEVLSQEEISNRVFYNKLTLYCGKCGQKMERSSHNPRAYRICPCYPREKIIDSVGVYRIVDNRVLFDMVIVPDDQFDPRLHAPPLSNIKKYGLFKQSGRHQRKVS